MQWPSNAPAMLAALPLPLPVSRRSRQARPPGVANDAQQCAPTRRVQQRGSSALLRNGASHRLEQQILEEITPAQLAISDVVRSCGVVEVVSSQQMSCLSVATACPRRPSYLSNFPRILGRQHKVKYFQCVCLDCCSQFLIACNIRH